MKIPLLILSLVLCTAAGLADVSATTMRYLTLSDLSRQATAVFQGRVHSSRVVVIQGRYWTDTTVTVQRAIRGVQARKVIVLRQPGGTKGQVVMSVGGAARFHPGEQVLVFARKAGSSWAPVGMAQGKFTVTRGAARRDLSDINLIRIQHPRQEFAVRQLDEAARSLRTGRR